VTSLVALRILGGTCVVLFAVALLRGWGELAGFLDAPKHFPYRGLGWVTPLPPRGLRGAAAAMGIVVVDRATRQASTRSIEGSLRPDLRGRVWCDTYSIWRSAQETAREGDVEVHAVATASIDDRPPSPMIDADADLSREAFPLVGVPRWVRLREVGR
jgi:hypothetical protein